MSTGFEIEGKLIEKFDEIQVSDKFKKREELKQKKKKKGNKNGG